MHLRLRLRCLGAALLIFFCIAPARAQMQALSETELSHVTGQGLFTISNTSLNGVDFTRIGLDADVTLNANLRAIRLGEYSYAPRNGTGADLDIGAFQFGRSDASADQRLVHITNPYMEFVTITGSSGQREVAGMRLGFDGISGDIGLKIASLSGSLLVDGGAAGKIDSNVNDSGGGKRWDGVCNTCTTATTTVAAPTLSQLGGVHAGDANGASRDFWISLLKLPVQFPAADGMAAPTVAQAGVWLNWRDRLTALNLTGTLPPNTPAGH